ncbi:MAG: FAD-dependent monooxygenase [Phycisphaerales bacterium]|nr:FAD-dependent monooxygenase [Planctomycetota bacterium]
MSEQSSISTLAESWDVIVVGAGPAGSAAAYSCATRGLRVLLLEKALFPRFKVCGGCLSPGAMESLYRMNAMDRVLKHSIPLSSFRLSAGSCSASIPISGGFAIAREALDQELALHARASGATLAFGVSATLERSGSDGCLVRVSGEGRAATLRAGLAICADGLSGSFLPQEGWEPVVTRNSRFGVAARLPAASLNGAAPDNCISMHSGAGGYLGMVRLADGSIDAAAALDPAFTKQVGGPGGAVASLIPHLLPEERRVLETAAWRGTPKLTRIRRVEGPGVLVVGDAAAYVEPFTGEGMTWALRHGLRVGEFAARICEGGYQAGAWASEWKRAALPRRLACRTVSLGLRSPRAVRGAIALLRHFAGARAVARRLVGGPWAGSSRLGASAA